MTEEDALDALNVALADYDPPCTGLDVFTADKLTLAEELGCARLCARCSVAPLCDAYATAARVDFGFWAGRSRARRRKR